MSDNEPRAGGTRTGRVCDVAAAMEKRDSHSDFDDVVRLLGRAAQRPDSPGQAHPLATRTTHERSTDCPACWRAPTAPRSSGATPCCASCDERWAAAGRGGRLVVLTGEPGIGKTRLAARFAAATGATVLYGRADEESVSPFQPFVEALRYYAARHPRAAEEAGLTPAATEELARLVPELGPSAAAPVVPHPEERDRERHQLFDGAVRLLLHAAGQPPAAARDRRPAVGRRADAAPAAPAAAPRSRRPAAHARDLQRARGARDGPAAPARRHAPRGARGHHPRRRTGRGGIGGAGRRARRSRAETTARRRSGCATRPAAIPSSSGSCCTTAARPRSSRSRACPRASRT